MKQRLSILIFLTISQFVLSQNTILWEITDTLNSKTSFIVGTFHQFGNSFVDSIPIIKQHLYNSELAIFESIDAFDKTTNEINKREESIEIKKRLKKNDYLQLLKISENWKVDIHKLKPIELRWKLEQEFVKIKCKTVLENDKWDHFDYYLQHLAKKENIEITGLETNKEQLNFINIENDFPNWKDERKRISYLLNQVNRTDYNKKKCALAEKYRRFDLDYKLNEECKESVLLKDRNENWMKILPKLLSENNCFVAVGLRHLYYKCGILEQLKNEGFKVEPIEINPDVNAHNIQEIERKFQTILDSTYQANQDAIGIMVHIESPKNGISWSGSVGYSDKEKKIELSSDQPALIASSIKTYISATILKLQEQKKLSIEDNVSKYLTQKTNDLFISDGYNLDKIKIKHLLSHTSGIEDYANEEYLNWIDKNQKHRWTRDEQLQLAIKVGNPLGKPQEHFNYADANYLLCTEIIEQITEKPFYEAIRELLEYKKLGLVNTWFPILENIPKNTKKLVHQYWGEKNWDSYNHDISWDLYGGGGIATTTKELAQFSYNLFNEKIIEDTGVLDLLSVEIKTLDKKDNKYGLGLSLGQVKGFKSFGHGGFWGTVVLYFPKLDASISVYVLERDKRKLRKDILQALVTELSSQLFPLEQNSITKNYELEEFNTNSNKE